MDNQNVNFIIFLWDCHFCIWGTSQPMVSIGVVECWHWTTVMRMRYLVWNRFRDWNSPFEAASPPWHLRRSCLHLARSYKKCSHFQTIFHWWISDQWSVIISHMMAWIGIPSTSMWKSPRLGFLKTSSCWTFGKASHSNFLSNFAP